MIAFNTFNNGHGLQGPTWIKECIQCGWQPVEGFSKDSSKKDGLRNTCKDCDNINRKERYINNGR